MIIELVWHELHLSGKFNVNLFQICRCIYRSALIALSVLLSAAAEKN